MELLFKVVADKPPRLGIKHPYAYQALKDYESLKSEKVKLEENVKNLDVNNKNLQEELKECKKQSILEGKKKD